VGVPEDIREEALGRLDKHLRDVFETAELTFVIR
jgi:hypothetical protein